MNSRFRQSFSQCMAAILVFGTIGWPPTTQACKSTRCQVLPGCAKSAVLFKAVPRVVALPPGGGVFLLPTAVVVTCGNNCGGACNPAPAVASASTTVTVCPGAPPCAAGCASPIPAVTVSTVAGTMPLPTCNSRGVITRFAVPIAVPGGVFGLFCVTATTTITFTDGMVLRATGDQLVCIVDELPGQPGVPRLDLAIDTTGFVNDTVACAPGDQVNIRYIITNNDPTETFTIPVGNTTATSNQVARRPETDPPGMTESDGVYAISGLTADDFPIVFDPAPGSCMPLPPDPATFVQPPITHPSQIVIPPLSQATVTVGIRSFPACSNGSCSETTFSVEGTFSPSGDPGLACAGTALVVDTTIPFPGGEPPCEPCGFPENDCNQNGVYDGDDIYVNQTSLDENLNAIPDECEPAVPAVSPTGMVGMFLLLAAVAVVVLRRARSATESASG